MARFLTLFLVCALAVVGVMAAPAQPKSKDLTSWFSQIFGYTDGRKVYTQCPVSKTVPKTYTSNSLGACSPSKKLCGKQIYAYRGNGTDGSKYHTNGKTYIIDICKTQNVSSTDINFTLASFKQLGGSVKGGNLTNVNYKFL